MQEYGKLALVTHLTLSLISFSSIYFLVYKGFDLDFILNKFNFNKHKNKENKENKSINKYGHLTLSFVIYKAISPIRYSLTFITVPIIAKLLKRK